VTGARASSETPTGVPAQAAHWFARMLDPDCSARERAAFERWHAADLAHAAAYQAMQGVWERSNEVVQNDHDIAAAARRAFKFRSPQAARRRGWLPWAVAAGLSMVAILVIGRFWSTALPLAGTQYATAIGEQRTIALADDSVLVLDTGTVLVERYSLHERRVELQQGQAEFQVQGDPRRPFVVHAPGGTITAVGTRFQVRVDHNGGSITLLEGQVRIDANQGHGTPAILLKPGERVRYSGDGRFGAVEPANLRLAHGWTEGRLLVDDWSLHDLVTEINRYSEVQLRIGDPTLGTVKIRGAFRTHDRGNLAKALEQGWDIRALQVSEREILLTRR